MKETNQNDDGNRKEIRQGEFIAEREFYRPFRPAMLEVEFQQRTGGFLEFGPTINEGMTQERAMALAESLDRASEPLPS